MKREHLANFNIAGFTYYEGVLCFQKLTIGTELRLVLEEQNQYDPRAVAIYFGDHKLGFVPRNENRIFYKMLALGFDCFETRVQMIDASECPEGQVSVVVHLVAESNEKL